LASRALGSANPVNLSLEEHVTTPGNARMRLGLLLLAVPLSLALIVGASAAPTTRAAASSPAPTEAQRRFEVQFMKRMIDHHFMAVRMAQQCVAKAKHEQLRDQCAEIARMQGEEIRMMRSWLQRWYSTDHRPHLGLSERAQLRELAAAHGAKYEIMVMEMFIDHHAVALLRAEDCITRAYHDRLRDTCQMIIETQRAEIARFRTWLRNWYGIYA
jgi:uncharacterized protein (DUF305 family)